MYPKLRSILIGIGLLTLVILAIVLIPRGLSLYYQSRGGQHIDYVMRAVEGIQELVCEPLPESNQAAIEEVDRGIANLQRAVRFNRRSAQSYYHLGKAYCLLGEPGEAQKNYQQYTELRPDNPLGYIGLGFAYEALGEAEKSKETWIQAGLEPHEFNAVGDQLFSLEDYNQAIEWYERALLLNPELTESLISLGDSHSAIDHPKEAINAYLQAWNYDPELSIKPLILAFQEKGNFIAVEEYLSQVLEKFPDSSDRLYWFKELGKSYRDHGDHEQAIEIYSQAIDEYPDRPNLHLTLGWIYFDQGENYQLAVQEFENTIQLDESIAESYYGIARINNRQNKFQDADFYFGEALKRSPNNRWYYLERGDNARSAGELDRAIDIYEQTLAMYPDFAYGYYQLAQAYQMDGRLNESIEAIELAINNNKYPADHFYARAGNIYRTAGFNEKALSAYQLALSINPDNEIAVQGLNSMDELD